MVSNHHSYRCTTIATQILNEMFCMGLSSMTMCPSRLLAMEAHLPDCPQLTSLYSSEGIGACASIKPISHLLQVATVRNVEVQIEDAIEKVKGAIKELTKGIKDLNKVIDADLKELQKYYQEYQGLIEGAAATSEGGW